ncbi:hypothetical protein ACVIDN_005376 [Rhizobium brockwellii]
MHSGARGMTRSELDQAMKPFRQRLPEMIAAAVIADHGGNTRMLPYPLVPPDYWRDHFCDSQTTFITQPLRVTVSPETLMVPS